MKQIMMSLVVLLCLPGAVMAKDERGKHEHGKHGHEIRNGQSASPMVSGFQQLDALGFSILDTDGNGELTRKEIQSYFRGAGIRASNRDIRDFVETYDRDRSRSLDIEEYPGPNVVMRSFGAINADQAIRAIPLADYHGNDF